MFFTEIGVILALKIIGQNENHSRNKRYALAQRR